MLHPSLLRVALVVIGIGLVASACDDDDPVAPEQQPDIVETAIDAGSFETLVTAVQAAGLVETLQGPGPFTVFAPSDEAFARLPAGTVDNLLLPENRDQLISILTYHVVPGRLLAGDVLNSTTLTTVQGQTLAVSLDGGTPKVNDSAIVATDIEASNGVIHVIDTVLLPN
ncbi:MAG: fasciclin domain-containing protein [Gemmatimonadota bacterium]|nr:fasciclin domain-containing protein [Gemmatimonadota bacterium]